jgi:16S rRNA (cytidine1402-2'-O)-methyltransferase
VLGGAKPAKQEPWDEKQLKSELEGLIAGGLSASEAAKQLAQITGQQRRVLYGLLHKAD